MTLRISRPFPVVPPAHWNRRAPPRLPPPLLAPVFLLATHVSVSAILPRSARSRGHSPARPPPPRCNDRQLQAKHTCCQRRRSLGRSGASREKRISLRALAMAQLGCRRGSGFNASVRSRPYRCSRPVAGGTRSSVQECVCRIARARWRPLSKSTDVTAATSGIIRDLLAKCLDRDNVVALYGLLKIQVGHTGDGYTSAERTTP